MAMTPHNLALDLLARRAYASKDLRRKLIQKKVSPAEADAVIERCIETGLLNDAAYAAAYARAKLLRAGVSDRRIAQELARKGIPSGVVTSAVEQIMLDEDVDTQAIIERVARKKLATLGGLEPLVLRRRLSAFLMRRGYDLDDVQAVVRRLVMQE